MLQKLNSTESSIIDLQVPNNTILAIDGILVSEQQTSNTDRNIWAVNRSNYKDANYTSKILVEGYMKDVELVGKIIASNLIIDASSYAETSGLTFIGHNGEIYGELVMNDNAKILIEQVDVTMRSGAQIIMNGNNDLIIGWGSSSADSRLIMDYASSVKANNNNKIIIEAGCSLIVDYGARVNLDCEIIVKDGGSLILRDSSIVYLKKFTILNGGSFIINKEVNLHLMDKESQCWGIMEFNGDPDQTSTGGRNGRIYVTGKISDECNYYQRSHNNGSVTDYHTIFYRNNIPNNPDSKLTINNTDFVCTFIKAFNYEIAPVNNSNFIMRKLYTTPGNGFLWVKSIFEIHNEPLYAHSSEYSFINCNFY